MRRILTIGLFMLAGAAGCSGSDRTPPPQPARVPGPHELRMSEDWQASKPLPDQSPTQIPPPPFNDSPIVSQEVPETSKFVEAYNKVGHPRVLVWVMSQPAAGYDEAAARSIDYSAMQTILTDWLAAGGRVALISPEAAHQALTPQQTQSLNSGQGVNGKEISDRIHADVLVSVRADVTRQSGDGLAVRLVADASNLAGGESIGRAVVDVPPPLDKPQLNTYTRFLARKLMQDMTNAWTAFGAPPTTAPR